MKLSKPTDFTIITTSDEIKITGDKYIELIENILTKLKLDNNISIKNNKISFRVNNLDTQIRNFPLVVSYINEKYVQNGWKSIFIANDNHTYTDGVGTMERDYLQVAGIVTLYI